MVLKQGTVDGGSGTGTGSWLLVTRCVYLLNLLHLELYHLAPVSLTASEHRRDCRNSYQMIITQ